MEKQYENYLNEITFIYKRNKWIYLKIFCYYFLKIFYKLKIYFRFIGMFIFEF